MADFMQMLKQLYLESKQNRIWRDWEKTLQLLQQSINKDLNNLRLIILALESIWKEIFSIFSKDKMSKLLRLKKELFSLVISAKELLKCQSKMLEQNIYCICSPVNSRDYSLNILNFKAKSTKELLNSSNNKL